MRWGWGAAAVAVLGGVFVASGWVHPAILAYHAVAIAGIVRHRKRLRPLLAWDGRILRWTLGTTAVIVAGLLLPRLFFDPVAVRERAVAVLFPVADRGRLFAGFAVYTLLVHAWVEEVFWRGVFTDVEAARLPTVVVGNAVGFYLVHAVALAYALGGMGWLLALPTAGAGAVWGFVTGRTRSLWPAIASHYAADLVILGGMWLYFVRS
jgi:membrane protease YdiL (CAAX protease family)